MTPRVGPTAERRMTLHAVREIARQHLGSAPTRIAELSGGLSNEVFRLEHRRGRFVVRLGRSPATYEGYLKEQWAVARAGTVGVPTPAIIHVGNDIGPAPYMLSRSVNGREAWRHPDRSAVLRAMGAMLARIHRVRTAGYGSAFDRAVRRLGGPTRWRDFLDHELRIDDRLAALSRHRLLPPRKLRRLRDVLESGPRASVRTVLNHGDMRLKNVLVDARGAIATILDWDQAYSNVPHWDLAIALHDLTIDEKDELLAGYGMSASAFALAAPLIAALNLINYGAHLPAADAGDRQVRLDRLRRRLSGALDLYSLE
ncbi:MAG: aminoglycoside phosphotransferase family protein [Planctomycetes bacterium]|nr:aminoglycoside phosphotransferase family protein [Planctomycetota bacterium]